MSFVMHRAGRNIVKISRLIHPPSKDIPNNFVPLDIVMTVPELCGDLMGQGQGAFTARHQWLQLPQLEENNLSLFYWWLI